VNMRVALVCALLLALLSPLTALAAPLSGPAGHGELPAPLWQSLSNANWVSDIAVEGDYLWAATGGGVVRWDSVGDTYMKYTTADGLLDNVVYCVAVDEEGQKWFGTSYGVSYFDGSLWHNYTQVTTEAGESASLDHVLAIAVDGDGTKWIGFAWGVAAFDDARWQLWTEDTGLPHNAVTGIAIDGERKWFSTRGGGVLSLQDGVWTQYTAAANGLASDQVEGIAAANGRVWCGTWAGVSVFDGTGWTTYRDEGEGVVPEAGVDAIAADGEGRLWVGCADGVALLDGDGWQRLTTSDGLPQASVRAIAFDAVGYAWLGTSGAGLAEDTRRGWVAHRLDEPLPSNEVLAVAVDGEGALWLGTIAGLARVTDDGWTSRLAGEAVATIAEDPRGRMWFGTLGHGAYMLCGELWTSYTTATGLPDDSVYAFAFDAAGNTWIGTQRGVSRLSADGTLTTFDRSHTGHADPGGDRVRALFVDQTGALWVGTAGGGVSRFDGSRWLTYSEASTRGGLAYDWVYCIAQDAAGTLWFGTGGGLSGLKGGQWTRYDKPSGLGGLSIRGMTLDGAGGLWLAMDGGLACFRDGRWLSYTSSSGLASNAVNALAIDGQQRLWLGTDGGLTQVPALPDCPEPAAVVEPAVP
jgi:ligand-binding sensor domain-containing protein